MVFRYCRDYLRPNLGPNISPFPIKNEQNLPELVYNIPNIFALHFGENFIKIGPKIANLQMFTCI